MTSKSRHRPVVVPAFGAYLARLRGRSSRRARSSRGAICKRLEQYGLTLDRSTLLQYERGTVTAPDPAILWGLSRLYHVPFDEMVLELVRERSKTPEALPADTRPSLDHEQRLIAEWFGRLGDDSRHAVSVILEALAPRRLAHEGDRRRHRA